MSKHICPVFAVPENGVALAPFENDSCRISKKSRFYNKCWGERNIPAFFNIKKEA
jgi:hypothetical protein